MPRSRGSRYEFENFARPARRGLPTGLDADRVSDAILWIVRSKVSNGKDVGTQLNNLLVMKFGGTSMGSAERMKVAAAICSEHARTRPVVCVVSAMSKVTDLLLDSLR